jgi:hypothetical protein
VTGAGEQSAGVRPQREDVAGADERRRTGVLARQQPDGPRPLAGGNAGGGALDGINRHHERRAVVVAIAGDAVDAKPRAQ